MNKKEIQEKLDNLPKPKYLYQRYNGDLYKYEVDDNILIDTKNANNIINLDKQSILGKTSENILDLLEVGDVVIHGELTIFKTIFEDKDQLDYFVDLYKHENLSINQVVTREKIEKDKFEV